MSDILQEPTVQLSSYESFVQTERKIESPIEDQEWLLKRVTDLDGEAVEFMGQHGPAGVVLAPQQFQERFESLTIPHPELRYAMADELSDMLWYSFDIAAHQKLNPGEISVEALKAHTGEELQPPASFQEMQTNVMSQSHRIRFTGQPGQLVALSESPFQVFAAAHLRLMAALQKNLPEPVVEMDEDPTIELAPALGDYINVLVYIAKERLGINIEDIARYNVFKLRDRRQSGKKIGHLFAKFIEFQQQNSLDSKDE